MLTSTTTYKQAITRPHHRHFRVDLYQGTTLENDTLLAQDVPIFGGQINANLAQRVTRSGTFDLGAEWYPLLADDPLSPYQTVARISAGIRYGDGSTELFPIITGRTGTAQRNEDGTCSVRVEDLAADVVGFEFEQPRNSENVSVVNQIRRLISEAVDGAAFGPDDVTDTATPRLTWDQSRGDALDTLSSAVSGRWFTLGSGSFVVRELPYDVGTAVQQIVDGPGGLLLAGRPSVTRDGAANSVTVVVERADGGVPFRVTARDTTAGSPTQFGGPFGRVTKLVKVQTPLTNGQAQAYARALLNASTALASQWSVSCVADYTLEPQDTVLLRSRGVQGTQVIDSITYPLDDSPMSIGTRSYVRTNL